MVTGLEAIRSAAASLRKALAEYRQHVARGEGVRIVNGVTYVDKKIDKEIRRDCEEVIGTTCRVMKNRMQVLLRTLGFEIGFLYQQEGAFNTGLTKMKQQEPAFG